MPTISRIGPYRLFFYAGDRDEPEHVHVERDDQLAKFWLDYKVAVALAGVKSIAFRSWSKTTAKI